jgi:hypothetical protein
MLEKLKTELEKPAYAELSDEAALAAVAALTLPTQQRDVFGSFRTLAALLSQTEYNTLRAVLKSASDTETAAGGTMLADMTAMLSLPGDSEGNGGGVALNSPGVVAMLQQFAAVEGLEEVPAKIAAYCATYQPTPQAVFSGVQLSDVEIARGTRPLVQVEVNHAE